MAHANMDYHMDFFSLLTLAHDLGEPKSENYAKCFTSASDSTGVTPYFQNHHQQHIAEGLSSSASAGPAECRNGVNGYSENDFETRASVSSFCVSQGTKRTRDGLGGQFEPASSPHTTTTHSKEANSENSCGPAKRPCGNESGLRLCQLAMMNAQHIQSPNMEIISAEMNFEPHSNGVVQHTSNGKASSYCAQCGRKKHKKFCTGYIEEMLYCSQMPANDSSFSHMLCSRCLSGQSGHRDHISHTSSALMDTS